MKDSRLPIILSASVRTEESQNTALQKALPLAVIQQPSFNNNEIYKTTTYYRKRTAWIWFHLPIDEYLFLLG